METYIRKNIPGYFIEFPEEIDSVYWEGKIGTTWQDFEDGKWIHLSTAQVAFYNEHPQATVKEVWDMELSPCPEPEQESEQEIQPEPSSQYTLVDLSGNLSSEEKSSIITNLGLPDNKIVEEIEQNNILQPNVYYELGEIEILEFTLGNPITGIVNEYSFSFDSPQNNATSLMLPQNIIWSDIPQVKGGHHYKIDIIYSAYNDTYYGKINEW